MLTLIITIFSDLRSKLISRFRFHQTSARNILDLIRRRGQKHLLYTKYELNMNLLVLSALIFASGIMHSDCYVCNTKFSVGGCVCDITHKGDYHVQCPTRLQRRLDIRWKPRFNALEMTCSENITYHEMREYVQSLHLGQIDSLRIESCKIRSSVLVDLNSTEVTELIILKSDLSVKDEQLIMAPLTGMDFVTQLYVIYHQNPHFDRDSWPRNNSLMLLDLHNNKKISLSDDTFMDLQQLEMLDLSQCDLTELNSNLFRGLTNLKKINLYNNRLHVLENMVFRPLISLEQINLNMNRLKTLPERIFSYMFNLSSIYLNCNPFKQLPKQMALKNSKLSHFTMTGNERLCGEKRSEANLVLRNHQFFSSSLEVMKISHMKVKKMSPLWLRGCKNLTSLSLTWTDLSLIPHNMFKEMTKINYLDLSHNNIKQLDKKVFYGLRNLQILHLNENKIKFVDLTLVRKSIKHLDLSFNFMTGFNHNSDSSPPFEKFDTLTYLNLSHNQLSKLKRNLFSRNLEQLDLSFNKLKGWLVMEDIHSFQNTTINLSNNFINGVENSHLHKKRKSCQHKVDLSFNPIICDCNAVFLKSHLTEDRNGVTFSGVVCSSGKKLSETPLHCPVLGCPIPCHCWFNEAANMATVNCRNKNLTTIPSFINLHFENVSSVNVDLSRNLINNLESLAFDKPLMESNKITAIDISHNQVDSFDTEYLPKNLKILDISYNKMATFSAASMNYIDTLDFVKLGNNPYECSCKNKQLKTYLSTKSPVHDALDVSISCEGKNQILFLTSEEDLCPETKFHSSSFVLICIFSSICVLLLVVSVVVTKGKTVIRVYLYSVPWIRSLTPKNQNELDRPWDVLLYYCDSNARFVEDTLYPGLKLRGYTVFTPADIQPGLPLQQTLCEQQKFCKRFIFFMTEDLLQEQSMMFQFKAARSESIHSSAEVNRDKF